MTTANMMLVRTSHVAQGAFVNIQTAGRDLTIRTETGTPVELLAAANKMEADALRALARVALMRQAAEQMAAASAD